MASKIELCHVPCLIYDISLVCMFIKTFRTACSERNVYGFGINDYLILPYIMFLLTFLFLIDVDTPETLVYLVHIPQSVPLFHTIFN